MNNLKKYREDAGLTVRELATLCGFKGGSRIGNYESGRVPSLADCRRIVFALNQSGLFCTLDMVFPPRIDKDEAA